MSSVVYVAASSDELDRAQWAMGQVRAEGWEVALDWVAQIREVGIANPTNVPTSRRRAWAGAALEAVERSHALWLLAPEHGHGRGAFCELQAAVDRRVPVVVSGPAYACSIFTAQGHEVASDAEGLEVLRTWLGTRQDALRATIVDSGQLGTPGPRNALTTQPIDSGGGANKRLQCVSPESVATFGAEPEVGWRVPLSWPKEET